MLFRKPVEITIETVVCDGCKHVIAESSAQRVQTPIGTAYYCRNDKKNYDSVVDRWNPLSQKDVRRYYTRMEVSEDGTPIGYVKEPEVEVKWKGGQFTGSPELSHEPKMGRIPKYKTEAEKKAAKKAYAKKWYKRNKKRLAANAA